MLHDGGVGGYFGDGWLYVKRTFGAVDAAAAYDPFGPLGGGRLKGVFVLFYGVGRRLRVLRDFR